MIEQAKVEQVVAFHGHMCAGLAMGIRAAEVALAEVGPNAPGEEVVAVVETDMCAVDAIQYLTGCTLGKGNLIHRDHGKNAYTFIRRSDGAAVRVSPRPHRGSTRGEGWFAVLARMRAGLATPEEREGFVETQRRRSDQVLAAPLDELYEVHRLQAEAPPPARILASDDCAACGEATMETRIRRLDNQDLCLPCFEQALAGNVAVAAPRTLARR